MSCATAPAASSKIATTVPDAADGLSYSRSVPALVDLIEQPRYVPGPVRTAPLPVTGIAAPALVDI
jgi:hypothetical protein